MLSIKKERTIQYFCLLCVCHILGLQVAVKTAHVPACWSSQTMDQQLRTLRFTLLTTLIHYTPQLCKKLRRNCICWILVSMNCTMMELFQTYYMIMKYFRLCCVAGFCLLVIVFPPYGVVLLSACWMLPWRVFRVFVVPVEYLHRDCVCICSVV